MRYLIEAGVRKTGQAALPGGFGFPAFSDVAVERRVHPAIDALPRSDRFGVKAIFVVLGLMPRAWVSFFVRGLPLLSRKPGVIGVMGRKLEIGLLGLVYGLYYSRWSEGSASANIYAAMGWQSQVSVNPELDSHFKAVFRADVGVP